MQKTNLARILVCCLGLSLINCAPLDGNDDDREKRGQDKDILEQITDANQKTTQKVFEGDIVLTPKDKVDQSTTGDVDGPLSDIPYKRNAQRSRLKLWKSKTVPYEIDSAIPVTYRTVIASAIDEIEKHTCIKFSPVKTEKNWIKFIHGSGCWSYVGMIYYRSGSQSVSIGNGCNHKGVIMHELLHALGFWHEQSRPDRNQYVEVFWENIKKGSESNFNKYSHGSIDTLKQSYDFKSIMHYGKYAFSKNRKPTIQGIGPNKDTSLGQRNVLSKTDIYEINALYDCSGPNGGWSSWSDFGPCDYKCEKVRERFCASSDRSNCPRADRYGIGKDRIKCSDAECYAPVHGHWGRWSALSQCDVNCGFGSQSRTRVCDDPKPKNGGKDCVGKGKQTKTCFTKTCGLGANDCDFEVNMCFWSQKNQKNSYKWYRISGSTTSRNTGPTGDATPTMLGKGYYVYAEASSPARTGQVAKLQSKEFAASPDKRCLQFSYNMYGGNVNALNVYIIDTKTGNQAKIFSKHGNQGQRWYRTNATFTSNDPYKISFEATRGNNWNGDIALDDIFLKNYGCNVKPPSTTAPQPPSTTAPRPPSTTAPQPPRTAAPRPPSTAAPRPPTTSRPPATHVGDCTFEKKCSWYQANRRNPYKWLRRSGKTPSWGTGPNGDITANKHGKGHYIYAEASYCWRANRGDVAKLRSKAFKPVPQGLCFGFAYNMYGSTMGSLEVYVTDLKFGNRTRIFFKSGNQKESWKRTEVTIFSDQLFEVSFEAIRGSSYRSDIALDDINFQDGPCVYKPVSLDCDFETDLCAWQSVRGTNRFPWARRSGSTPSRGTGPNGDSTGSTSGSYVYMETSHSYGRGQTAYLVSPEVAPSKSSHCLSFFYHMYGRTMGTLKVSIKDKQQNSVLSTITGNQGNSWHYKEVNITSRNKYQVVFVGVRGYSYLSDIAIDNIKLKRAPCQQIP